MKNTKLIQVLKSFSKEEMKEFEKYLSSPFFGCSPFILNFFMELKKHYPDFIDDHIKKERIYSKLYKGQKFSDTNIKRISSALMRMSLDFMAIKNFRKTEGFYNFCLLQDLRMRKLFPIIETESKNMRKKKDLNKKIHSGLFLSEFLFNSETINYKMESNMMTSAPGDVKDKGNNLLIFFLTGLTYFFHLKDLLKTRYNNDVNCLLNENFFKYFNYEKFIESLDNDTTTGAKFLKINYYNFQLILNINPHENYLKIKDLWVNSKEYLHEHQRRAYYHFLINFCTSQNRKNDSKYFREDFNLRQVYLKDKLFLVNSNTMSITEFWNIVNVSLKLKEYKWLEDFIKTHSKYLIQELRESMVEYGYSSLEFEKGQFEKALERLDKIKQESPLFKLILKELLLKIYYEQKYTESAHSLVDSFKHFLNDNNNKILPDLITNSKNFLKYYGSLLKIRDVKECNEIKEIEIDIENENNINNKFWLLDKIKELK